MIRFSGRMDNEGEEYPPLWPPGFHQKTLEDIAEACVKKFTLSSTRGDLFEALCLVVACLKDEKIVGDIWLDGSFVTEKTDPLDVDFILSCKSEFFDAANDRQRLVIDCLIDGDLWELPFLCDTNVMFVDPPEMGGSEAVVKYWTDRFGFSTDKRVPKGIITIRLEGADDEDDYPDSDANPEG
jgi:hypothetical protein